MLNACELKAARVRRGYKQSELARAMGMSPSKYCLLEGKRQPMTLSDANTIANTLDMTGEEVLTVFFGDRLHSNAIDAEAETNTGAHDNTRQVHVDGCTVMYAVCSCCFWVEIRLLCGRAVNKHPAYRIGNGGFADAVRAVDVRVLAIEVYGKFLNSSEISERKAQNLHCVSPSHVLQCSCKLFWDAACFGHQPDKPFLFALIIS